MNRFPSYLEIIHTINEHFRINWAFYLILGIFLLGAYLKEF